MAALFQFNRVAIEKESPLSFTIATGETVILKVASNARKNEVIDLALGDLAPSVGEILLQGVQLEASGIGSVGWIPANGGLISNLKAWENITLPLWYHKGHQPKSTEERLIHWLSVLGIDSKAWEEFMSSPVARLKPVERKLAGLLRGLLLAPKLLVIDAALFEDIEADRAKIWSSTLEKFVCEADERALLVVASSDTSLPWKIIE